MAKAMKAMESSGAASSSRVRDALLEAARGPAAPAPAMKAMKAVLLLFVWFCESPMEG